MQVEASFMMCTSSAVSAPQVKLLRWLQVRRLLLTTTAASAVASKTRPLDAAGERRLGHNTRPSSASCTQSVS